MSDKFSKNPKISTLIIFSSFARNTSTTVNFKLSTFQQVASKISENLSVFRDGFESAPAYHWVKLRGVNASKFLALSWIY